jgi:diguanylate cyclase (GGDEF)-like protein
MLRKRKFQAVALIQGQPRPLLMAESICLVALFAVLDGLTSWELAFSPLYLIPIFFATYFVGTGFGVITSILCVTSWLAIDVAAQVPYSHPVYHSINSFIRLCSYLVFVSLLGSLNKALRHVRDLANTDGLTELLNARHFFHLAANEIQRAKRYRHAMTVAYIDLDGFKEVNDVIGHKEGDTVLRVVACTLRNSSRTSDLIARLGGDEFAVLIPEGGFDSSELFMTRLQHRLLESMKEHEWRVTFSIGAITFDTPPDSVDALLRQAEGLMYAAKRSGKNRMNHEHAGILVTGQPR